MAAALFRCPLSIILSRQCSDLGHFALRKASCIFCLCVREGILGTQGTTIPPTEGCPAPPCSLYAPGALPSHPARDAQHHHVDHLAPHCLWDSWPAPRDLPSDITPVVARHCTAALGPRWCRGVCCGIVGQSTADTMATS